MEFPLSRAVLTVVVIGNYMRSASSRDMDEFGELVGNSQTLRLYITGLIDQPEVGRKESTLIHSFIQLNSSQTVQTLLLVFAIS
jgi:hypothetical protein